MKQSTFDAGRISALSDGVFAIAMTLLVLELKLPEAGAEVNADEFDRLVLGQLPVFMSWILSFAILCRLWITQHALLKGDDRRSRGFTTWSFVFLGAVSFVPFPTSLLSEHHDQAISVVIFSVTLGVAGLAMGGMWKAERCARSADGEWPSVKGPVVIILLIAVVASGLAFINPTFGFVMWVAYPIGAAIYQHRHRSDSSSVDQLPGGGSR